MAKHVLVVEDEPDVLDALVQLLASAGFEVRGERDGLAGLRAFQEALRSVPFDLVMLDVMMPRIDGFTLCEAIRSSSDVPVMVITALDGEDDQLRAFHLLADDFVSKPFSLPVVLERARALLRRSSARPAPADAALAWRDVGARPRLARTIAGRGPRRAHQDRVRRPARPHVAAGQGALPRRARLRGRAGRPRRPHRRRVGREAPRHEHPPQARGRHRRDREGGWATVCRAIASSLSAKVFPAHGGAPRRRVPCPLRRPSRSRCRAATAPSPQPAPRRPPRRSPPSSPRRTPGRRRASSSASPLRTARRLTLSGEPGTATAGGGGFGGLRLHRVRCRRAGRRVERAPHHHRLIGCARNHRRRVPAPLSSGGPAHLGLLRCGRLGMHAFGCPARGGDRRRFRAPVAPRHDVVLRRAARRRGGACSRGASTPWRRGSGAPSASSGGPTSACAPRPTRLAHGKRERRDFLARRLPELKTPLAAARAQVEGMMLGIGDFADHEAHLPRALAALDRMDALVREMLAAARAESAPRRRPRPSTPARSRPRRCRRRGSSPRRAAWSSRCSPGCPARWWPSARSSSGPSPTPSPTPRATPRPAPARPSRSGAAACAWRTAASRCRPRSRPGSPSPSSAQTPRARATAAGSGPGASPSPHVPSSVWVLHSSSPVRTGRSSSRPTSPASPRRRERKTTERGPCANGCAPPSGASGRLRPPNPMERWFHVVSQTRAALPRAQAWQDAHAACPTLVVAVLALTSWSVRGAAQTAQLNVRQALGGTFTVEPDSSNMSNWGSSSVGTGSQITFQGEPLTADFVRDVVEGVDGVRGGSGSVSNVLIPRRRTARRRSSSSRARTATHRSPLLPGRRLRPHGAVLRRERQRLRLLLRQRLPAPRRGRARHRGLRRRRAREPRLPPRRTASPWATHSACAARPSMRRWRGIDVEDTRTQVKVAGIFEPTAKSQADLASWSMDNAIFGTISTLDTPARAPPRPATTE